MDPVTPRLVAGAGNDPALHPAHRHRLAAQTRIGRLLDRGKKGVGIEVDEHGRTEGWRDGGMEGWRDGGMEGWRDGGMEGWRDGGMEGWRDGGMEGWRDGGMEGWRDGGMEGWRDGGMEGWEGWRDGPSGDCGKGRQDTAQMNIFQGPWPFVERNRTARTGDIPSDFCWILCGSM